MFLNRRLVLTCKKKFYKKDNSPIEKWVNVLTEHFIEE